LGFALLVFIYGVRGAESVSVSVHELVSDDDDSSQSWPSGIGMAARNNAEGRLSDDFNRSG
jgi:hypothetical protein